MMPHLKDRKERRLWFTKMQSLPQHAKNLLNAFGVGSISYRSQCLLVEQAGDGNGATNYVPDWVDMFAKDWFVLGGE